MNILGDAMGKFLLRGSILRDIAQVYELLAII
jgi:hypothetical protein